MNELFRNLLTTSFHGSIVILVVILLRVLLKKAPRKFICFLWVLAGLRLLMRKLGAAPEESVLVGDGETDLRSARNAGLRSVAVTWGFRSREALLAEGPDGMAESPEELLTLLQTM